LIEPLDKNTHLRSVTKSKIRIYLSLSVMDK
jgi:hypothetical protein